MKKLIAILISILTAFTSLCAVFAADTADAYINDGSLVIEHKPYMSDTAVVAYYNGKTLCGAQLSHNDGGVYSFDIPRGYTKIRVWFTDEDETRTVQIIDRTSITPSPIPTATPSAVPTPEPTITTTEEPFEEEDEGYGGFLIPPNSSETAPPENENIEKFTFSVECHNALASDKLKNELRAVLPSDGFIAPEAKLELTDGMTVFDALMTAAEKCGFEVDYKSGYVSAISGLGEFDCGPFSGWMYIINGEAIMAPMDGYVIVENDVVQVAYTCSFGDDFGQEVE